MSGPKKSETPEKPETRRDACTPNPRPRQCPRDRHRRPRPPPPPSAAISDVRAKLVAGEQFVLGAAGWSSSLVSYLIWQFLLDYRIFVDNFVVLVAVLTVLAIWVHRWGHYDFGKAYRIIIGALGVSLALFALMNLLAWARLGGGSIGFLHLIGRLLYWAAGVAAFVGAWQVFRTRED